MWRRGIILILVFLFFKFSRAVHSPQLLFLRPWDSVIALIFGIVLFIQEVRICKRQFGKHVSFMFSCAILSLVFFSLATTITEEQTFQKTKNEILTGMHDDLYVLGQHFIVGYRSLDEAQALVKNGAVGGFYIAGRNVQGKSLEQIKEEVDFLQQLQKENHRPPLIIATDQEGGPVSRLTPPLTHQPSLGSLLSNNPICHPEFISGSPDNLCKNLISDYVTKQAQELKNIGVNVNFSPVVDIQPNTVYTQDKYTKISSRAISANPQIVSEVGLIYSQILQSNQIFPTLKHFPGIGEVKNDTHLTSAHLTKTKSELEKTDWLPFKTIAMQSASLVMLSHVILDDVDNLPSSYSEKVIGILRNDWKIQNVLITDDFSMGAIYYSQDKVAGATVKTLNAGADLILISFDNDLYYEAISSALTAFQNGNLNKTKLDQSHSRLTNLFSQLYN